ncbi:MAG: DUF4258 domain-containing protein [Candidatus Thermoplasmatota archaeon]|nr:DUF4258 domain-containing protein [Candidatus Thermoplasmatota archaeon]MBU4256429.1 DUF4258 domain-containing protein [Candidatus Thermoplasmatota archaeon]MCG2827477.1 DUF4258 domain-containing protein [Thermoplasmatales archaeon]
MGCAFRPTRHMKNMMLERGLSKKEIMDAVLKGAKRVKGRKITSLFKRIEVVFIKGICNYFVITSYWRR